MQIDILRIDRQKRKNIKDIVIEELFLTIYLDGEQPRTLVCSPGSLKELGAGLLYSSGLIDSINGIKDIKIDNQNRSVHIELNTKGAKAQLAPKRITSGLKIPCAKIIKLMNSFRKKSLLFKKTGAVHSAALSDGNRFLAYQEDIGRHNALDKLIGEALIKGLNMAGLIILTSGRISSEIISKVEKTGACFLISRAAPTDQAIKWAQELGLTLIGFVRGQRMNIYSASKRLI